MIEITKASTVAFMEVASSLVVRCREKHVNWKKKTENGENLFFKAPASRFWLTSKSYSWFNNVVNGRPSIKRTSWKGKLYATKSWLDVEFLKKINLKMVSGQKMKEEWHDQNY